MPWTDMMEVNNVIWGQVFSFSTSAAPGRDTLQRHFGMLDDQPASSLCKIMLIHHVTSLWESDLMSFPMSVCFWSHPSLAMLPVCDLYPSPTQSHVHFLWGQKHVPESRWLRGSGPVAVPHHTERLPPGAHVLKPAASKRSRVKGLSRTWFNPPVPFASQCLSMFPLFRPHFPHDMRISMMSPLPNMLMCPSHCYSQITQFMLVKVCDLD